MKRLEINEELVLGFNRPESVRFVSRTEATHTELVELVKHSMKLSGKDDPFSELTEFAYALVATAAADVTQKGKSDRVEWRPIESISLADGAELKQKRLINHEEGNFNKQLGYTVSNNILTACRKFFDTANLEFSNTEKGQLMKFRLEQASRPKFKARGATGKMAVSNTAMLESTHGLDTLAFMVASVIKHLAGLEIEELEVLRLKEKRYQRTLPSQIVPLLKCCLE